MSRSGTCAGYSWKLEWESLEGDMPEIQVNGSRLHGHDVQIAVSTLLDGGTWLRPLRGDMIRLPVPDTQVRILIMRAGFRQY